MPYDPARHHQALHTAQHLEGVSRLLLQKSSRLRMTVVAARTKRTARRNPRRLRGRPWPRRFGTAGTIDAWDSVSGQLTMGARTFAVGTTVAVAGLARGRHVLMSGEQAHRHAPHVVTRLIARGGPIVSPAPG
jgi:hypothetical protein